MYNVLVTSIGAKFPLLGALKSALYVLGEKAKLFGADANPACLGRYGVDAFWAMPPLASCTAQTFISYCKDQGIGAIIPTRDEDVHFFARHKAAFEGANIALFCAPLEAVEACQDKLFFASTHPLAIPTSTHISTLYASRFVVKERFGAGGRAMLLNATKTEALDFGKTLSSPLFQPFIQGEEFSVDGYVNGKGAWVGGVVRARLHVKHGEAKLTAYADAPALLEATKTLAQSLHVKGHLVAQFLQNDQGIHLIECNVRFGGASTLSYAMGLRSFEWFFKELLEESYVFVLDTSVTHQLRVEQDVRW